jgi:hypothetical protein
MSETTNNDFAGFEYLDLNTIDPTNSLPAGFYNLKVLGAQMLPHVNGPNSKEPGKNTTKIQFKFTVLDGDKAGRVITSTIFESIMAGVSLRKLMDATGVAQGAGEAFASWLDRVIDVAPDFRVMIKQTDRGNDVDYRTAQPNV